MNQYQLALGDEELFTVIYAVLDRHNGSVQWANGGHPPPLRTGSADSSYLEGGDKLLGIEELEYRDCHAPIAAGDVLILYTDGLIERRGETLDEGLKRLAVAAVSGPPEPELLCRHILGEVLPRGVRLHDEVTAVLVRIAAV